MQLEMLRRLEIGSGANVVRSANGEWGAAPQRGVVFHAGAGGSLRVAWRSWAVKSCLDRGSVHRSYAVDGRTCR